MTRKAIYSIEFAQCGAEQVLSCQLIRGEHNPRMWQGEASDAIYRIDYPRGYSMTRKAQEIWMGQTLRRLHTFRPRITVLINHETGQSQSM